MSTREHRDATPRENDSMWADSVCQVPVRFDELSETSRIGRAGLHPFGPFCASPGVDTDRIRGEERLSERRLQKVRVRERRLQSL